MLWCVSELSNGVVLFNDNGSPVTESRVSFSRFETRGNNSVSEICLCCGMQYIHFVTDHFGGPGRALGQVCVCLDNKMTSDSRSKAFSVVVHLDPIWVMLPGKLSSKVKVIFHCHCIMW